MEGKKSTNYILIGVFAVAVVALGFWIFSYEKPDTEEIIPEVAGSDISGTSFMSDQSDIWWDAKYNVNKENSELVWIGYKVSGSHTGAVGIKEGTIYEKDGVFAGGSFKIDMGTIFVSDIEDEKSNTDLLNQLNGADFFNVAQYPEAIFVIDRVIKEKGVNTYSVVGKFTIKGVEREIGLFSHIVKENNQYTVESDFAIDRTLWNIRYGSSKFFDDLGDKLIDDTIEFKLKMVLDKESVEEVIE